MAIADTIQSIKIHTQNAYDKIGKQGGTVPTNKNLENLSSSIESIPAGGGTDMLQSRVDETKDCSYLFYYYKGTNPDCVKNLDTSNVTNMGYMFSFCSSLTSLDVSNFNTSNVTNMEGIFRECKSLTSLNLSNFNTKNVTLMGGVFIGGGMFYNCSKLTSLDLSNFDTTNVTNMTNMFFGCSQLQHLDISNFDFTNVANYNKMFNGVPANCEILVKDETAKTWITSKFTNLTNVKVKGAV